MLGKSKLSEMYYDSGSKKSFITDGNGLVHVCDHIPVD